MMDVLFEKLAKLGLNMNEKETKMLHCNLPDANFDVMQLIGFWTDSRNARIDVRTCPDGLIRAFFEFEDGRRGKNVLDCWG